jgi:hypothetical protein
VAAATGISPDFKMDLVDAEDFQPALHLDKTRQAIRPEPNVFLKLLEELSAL